MLISELLQEAKKLYLKEIKDNKFSGMCWCIKVIANKYKSKEEQSRKCYIPYRNIELQIPEFNPSYLKSYIPCIAIDRYLDVGLEFWWDIEDTQSRIKAFDELIELYKDSNKEFIW